MEHLIRKKNNNKIKERQNKKKTKIIKFILCKKNKSNYKII